MKRLQNIPIRTERGRALRDVLMQLMQRTATPAVDYSQIELRVLAHLGLDMDGRPAGERIEDMSEYDWREGDHAHVVDGPHTGAEGRVNFLDRPRERALVDFGEGRKGGLTWVPLKDLRPAGGSLWSIPNRR